MFLELEIKKRDAIQHNVEEEGRAPDRKGLAGNGGDFWILF